MKAVIIVVAVFVCLLVLPVVAVFRSGEDDDAETPKQAEQRIRESDAFREAVQSEQVKQMAALVRSVPDVMRATLRADEFRIERRIDRIGEPVAVEGKSISFEQSLTAEQMEVLRFAVEDRLAPEYLTSPIYVGKRKERTIEGYYIFLDPQITGKIVDDRTREAIYNGERTSDL